MSSAWNVDRTSVHIPDPAIEVIDERFRSLVVGQEVVQRLWTGGRWLEGPVWFGDGRYLLFSDVPDNRMFCWSEATGTVTVFREPSNNGNGNTRDLQGRLITCEHLTPSGDPDRVRRHHHRPDGQLSGQAVERPERRDRALRRLGVVHRSWLGHRGQLRGDQGSQGDSAIRLPRRRRHRRRRTRHHRHGPPQRHLLLTRRVPAVCRRLRPAPGL